MRALTSIYNVVIVVAVFVMLVAAPQKFEDRETNDNEYLA